MSSATLTDSDSSPDPPKALSIRQPWAELILRGSKRIEIRTWATDHRGGLWLHTGRQGNRYQEIHYGLEGVFHGGYVGYCRLQTVIPFDKDKWSLWREHHLDYGAYKPGLYAFVLTEVLRFDEPLQSDGALKLFDPVPDILDELARRLELARTAGKPK